MDETLTDDARAAKMGDFVRHIRDHAAKLNAKAYWQQFSPAPDFVVMFLPGRASIARRSSTIRRCSSSTRAHA